MIDTHCGYCVKGEPLAKFGIYICDLSVSMLILFKEQSHPGRCIVAYKDHISEMTDMSAEERHAFYDDVARAAKASTRPFIPTKSTTVPMPTQAVTCTSTSCRSTRTNSNGTRPLR